MGGYTTFFGPTAPRVIGFYKGKSSSVWGESVQDLFLKYNAFPDFGIDVIRCAAFRDKG